MKRISLLLAVAALVFSDAPALAETAGASANTPSNVSIDTSGEVIRFIVDGREVARIDSRGLHVVGDVEYTGTLIDKKADWLKNDQHDTNSQKDQGHAE